VPPHDGETLAATILRLLRDPVLSRRLGEEGRRRALLDFDESRVFATVLREYERLLREKGLKARIPEARDSSAALAELRVARR
jgi:glycosyltransferase involved in cell wall biosynthesis